MSLNSNKKFRNPPQGSRHRQQQEKIVEFFLNLYSLQLNAPRNAPRMYKLKNHRQAAGFTYELKIQHAGKWVSRPMGILPIGEEAGKKSNCFKVVFDDILVVKIPKNPITAFEKYIEVILNERKIARLLHPDITCIVPAVSPILTKVPGFIEGMCWIPEEVEDKCIQRLKYFPKFQDCLKIGTQFAFFMDISKYSFLEQILHSIFDSEHKVKYEISKHPEMLTKFQKFEQRYGIEHTSTWLQINQIYHEYQNEIHGLLKAHGFDTAVHDYKRRTWFLTYLTENKVVTDNFQFPETFIYELNQTFAKLASRHGPVFRKYVKIVRAFVRNETFNQTKSEISIILTEILRLLILLKEKKVAVRDLKPDNIFVTDSILRNSSRYCRQNLFLGLIDLETAVSTDWAKHQKSDQPIFGGTPSYATPSNFVSNEILGKLFENVSKIFHFQDWHACIGMIYLAGTGDLLFNRSKNLLYDFISVLQNSRMNKDELLILFDKQNQLFWEAARTEFASKIKAKKLWLEDIEVKIPDEVSALFYAEALQLKEDLNRRFQSLFESQQIFKGSPGIWNSLKSNPKKVWHLRSRWNEVGLSSGDDSKFHRRTAILLKKLEDLAAFSSRLEKWMIRFKSETLTMNASDLLDFMFHVVLEAMYFKNQRGKNQV